MQDKHGVIGHLPHQLMTEIEPVSRSLDQETTLEQHFQRGHRVLRSRLFQEIQAEVAPDDGGQMEQVARRGG